MLRERIKEVERRKENNEKQAQNRKAYMAKITQELAELKQEFNRVQQITKFEAPKENKPAGGQSKSAEKVLITPKNGKAPSLELTEENYEKLKKEWKILMKAREGKSKRNQQDTNALNEDVASLEKTIEDKKQKYAEKEKVRSLLLKKMSHFSLGNLYFEQ